jgi:uncharacterized protein (DUF885 family)
MPSIDSIAAEYVERTVALDPSFATYAGIAGRDHELPDLSADGFAERAELDRSTLAALEAAEAPGLREQVARAAMRERLAIVVERYDAGDTTSELNVIESWVQGVRQLFDLMPTEGEEAAANIAARMAGVPEAYRQFSQTLLSAARNGRPPARLQVEEVAKQCADWSKPEDSFYSGLAERLTGAPDSLRGELDAAARAATAATAGLASFLTRELLPLAREKDACGPEVHARASRFFLGAAVDPQEAYAWSWEEIARLRAEQARVSNLIKPGATREEAMAILDEDSARRIEGRENFRAWMQELGDRAISELNGKHFDIPQPARRIEALIAPVNDGGIYYSAPSEDWSRPGRMWWSVPSGLDSFATWKEVTTVYHEGVPGHHLQISHTLAEQENLNRWQRLMCWVSGHGEGWATYAERLMGELGYLDDPGAHLGMLDMQLMAASNVALDIGVHLELEIPAGTGWPEGERWNAEIAWEFLRAHSSWDEKRLRFELHRYLGWPGQVLSYKLGERIWLQARDEAKARGGDTFSLKDFHTKALRLGAMGLDPLRDALASF